MDWDTNVEESVKVLSGDRSVWEMKNTRAHWICPRERLLLVVGKIRQMWRYCVGLPLPHLGDLSLKW